MQLLQLNTTVGIGTSLFVIRKTDDLIGLSTVKVGLGSTGVRFGLGINAGIHNLPLKKYNS